MSRQQGRAGRFAGHSSSPLLKRLVLEGAPWLGGIDICCGAAHLRNLTNGRPCLDGRPPSWLVRGAAAASRPSNDGQALASHASSSTASLSLPPLDSSTVTALARDTTVLVSSSARPRDDKDANVRMLTDSVLSVRRVLRLEGARVAVLFDGLLGKPGVTDSIRVRYASKIQRTLTGPLAPSIVALVSEVWLHQANSMRCALEHLPPTKLLVAIQDDTQLGGGHVDAHALHRLLLHDPLVEYVRFSQHSDCVDSRGIMHRTDVPCTPHPRSRLLHQTRRWLDRPHIATRMHYERRLFATLPRTAKVTPEQVLDQRSREERDWPLWLYGRRGEMQHDLHWPMLIDGQLVSKEFAGELLRRTGRTLDNVSMGSRYAHSYLIHAYRGKTQDVGAEQIAQGSRAYRAHNPLGWTAEDGLSQDDVKG